MSLKMAKMSGIQLQIKQAEKTLQIEGDEWWGKGDKIVISAMIYGAG